MKNRVRNRVSLAAIPPLFAMLLAACGGGGTTVAGGGSGGTGIGTVAGFGSVLVNGIEYATGGANIVVGGRENRPESELKVGMRVRVDGGFSATDNTGTARKVVAIRDVLGPMDDNGVDNILNRIRVAGQTVLVDPATIFDNVADLPALQSIQSGTLRHPELEVHGAADDGGFVHATYIRKGADDFPVLTDNTEVRGKIAGLDPVASRFLVGSLRVSYAGIPAGGKVNWPPTGLANGMRVEVKGKLTAAGGSGTLNATRIEVPDNSVGANTDSVRIEGYVVSAASGSSFALLGPGGNVTVDAVGASFVPPLPVGAQLVPGQKVQVEGVIAGQVIRASVVRLRVANGVKIEDSVVGLPNLAAGTFTVLFNKTVQVDGYTRFEDDVGDDRNFGLAKLNPGDNVQVVGSYDGTRFIAVRVERIVPDEPGKVLLQGPLDPGSIVPQVSFGIAGVIVTSLNAFANTEFRDASGNPVGLATFFGSVLPGLGPGQAVKVKRGVLVNENPPRIRDDDPARKMEIEIERINN